jgi:DNA ligase-1
MHKNKMEGGAQGPMLAKEWGKEQHKVRYPVWVQPKLDGMRMLYDSKTSQARARSGKMGKTSAQEPILQALAKAKWQGLTLDGELYKHGHSFQEVMRSLKAGGLQYHVYDIVSSQPFMQRYETLRKLYNAAPAVTKQHIKLVPTIPALSAEGVIKLQKKFVDQGYEGAIVRDPRAPYFHTRTSAASMRAKGRL